jgi:hypothetical protein
MDAAKVSGMSSSSVSIDYVLDGTSMSKIPKQPRSSSPALLRAVMPGGLDMPLPSVDAAKAKAGKHGRV